MTSVKITYQDETRRLLLRENGEALNYSRLITTLLSLFPSLCGKTFQLTWQDEDGDLITCCSDAELEDAIHVMTAKSRTLKFGVKLQPDDSNASSHRIRAVHNSVTCDQCGTSPIVGTRYKCAVRHDFDLCEACEAKRVQPYPMIKIVDPSQAPEVLVFGLRDGQRNEEGFGGFHGRHWQRGFRHHPPHPENPSNPANNNGGGCQWRRRRCDWGKKLEEHVAPFIQAMDSVVTNFIGEENGNCNGNATAPATAPAPNSAAQAKAEVVKPSTINSNEVSVEEALLEQAILESLTINERPKEPIAKPVDYVETSRPAVPTLPKPALRFVRDVTFPDGTAVHPGAVFRKTWRVRNDGSHAWPEGAALVSVGGDVLSDGNHREPLTPLSPDQETEIGLQLTAPHLPGMYTAYYRAQTKEQQYFGQRLWAAIVVTDNHQSSGEDWLEVSNNLSAPSPSAETANPLHVVPPAPSVVEEAKKSEEEASVVRETVMESMTLPPPPPPHLRSAILLWRRELAILSDMGFDDPEMILPLLQQHFSSPLSLSADKNASPNVESMQQVVAALLSLQH